MREKMEMLRQIAGTASTVLLVGEQGTGKNIIAQKIHQMSENAELPFVRVNCVRPMSTLPAVKSGTLFLNEISLLSADMQAETLSLILNQKDVRIIASTQRDLGQLSGSGHFMRELYFRIAVLPVSIPPLRWRVEDIAPLAHYFCARYALAVKKRIRGFTRRAMDALRGWFWPGNVRELKNCVERACMHAAETRIDEAGLFIRTDFCYTNKEKGYEWDLKTAIDAFKASFLARALEAYHGNQTKAARALGIQRTYLSKLIRELQIPRGSVERGAYDEYC